MNDSEQWEVEFDEAFQRSNRVLSESGAPAVGEWIKDFIRQQKTLAREEFIEIGSAEIELARQEGRDEAVDYIIEKVPATEVPMVLPSGMKIHPVLPGTLEAARHPKEGGK